MDFMCFFVPSLVTSLSHSLIQSPDITELYSVTGTGTLKEGKLKNQSSVEKWLLLLICYKF